MNILLVLFENGDLAVGREPVWSAKLVILAVAEYDQSEVLVFELHSY